MQHEQWRGNDKTKFTAGRGDVQFDRAFYEPGQTLTGMFFLMVEEPFKCDEVKLDVETEEKCEFLTFSTKTRQEGEETITETVTHEHKDKHDGFEFKSTLLDLEQVGKFFQIGNYCIQFQFKLPDVLPASLKFKDHKDKAKPEAKVVHEVKIKLKGTHFDEPSFKREFKVRNDQSMRKEKPQLEEKKDLKVNNYFCYAAGEMKIKAEFEKDFYQKSDKAKGSFICNMKDC